MINNRVVLDIDSKCNGFKINSAATAGFRLTGTTSALKLYGNFETGTSAMMNIYSLEFAGSALQTIKVNTDRGFGITLGRLIINNAEGINLLSTFGVINAGGTSETQFIKGKIFLGDYVLSCQTVLGANADKFFVTNGIGYLALPANTAGTMFNRFFPVGGSAMSYTPIRMTNNSTSWRVALMARAELNPSIFTSTPHVNVVYRLAPVSVIPGSDYPGWLHQVNWNTTDESAAFNHSAPVEAHRRTGTTWMPLGGSFGTPGGAAPVSFAFLSTTWESFGIYQASTPSSRLAAQSLPENVEKIEYKTYPNPATKAGFKVNVDDTETTTLKMTSLSGFDLNLKIQKESAHTISVRPEADITPGIYILQVKDKNSFRTHKVLIK